MGLMDKASDKLGGDNMRDRYEQLKSKAQAGELDDKGRAEYEQLRSHFEKHEG